MKLYTEEQVIEVFEKYGNMSAINARNIIDLSESIELPSDSLCINCDESKSTHNVCMDCMIKIGKENIELPSDEEIAREASNEYQEQKQSYENSVEMFPIDFGNYLEVGFIEGAKWMRDKIQGGNK